MMYICQEPQGAKSLVVALSGRNIPALSMFNFCAEMGLYRSVLVAIQPDNMEWYPIPNGIKDQAEAIHGININVLSLREKIRSLRDLFSMKQSETAIIGYSAGGVMALKIAEISSRPFAAIAAISAAILDPESLSPAPTNVPVLLKHNQDDDCFDWNERFLPTREALIKNNYNLTTEEDVIGGHGVCLRDAHIVGQFISNYLNYKQ